MSEKRYVLELAASSLATYDERGVLDKAFGEALEVVRDQARADRERDELRLPWRAEPCHTAGKWVVADCNGMNGGVSERAAKIRAAGHELLEAVQAVNSFYVGDRGTEYGRRVQPLIDRALRKVESGVPEEEG